MIVKILGYRQFQDCVAQKFQPFVMRQMERRVFIKIGTVHQSLFEQILVGKSNAQSFFQLRPFFHMCVRTYECRHETTNLRINVRKFAVSQMYPVICNELFFINFLNLSLRGHATENRAEHAVDEFSRGFSAKGFGQFNRFIDGNPRGNVGVEL